MEDTLRIAVIGAGEMSGGELTGDGPCLIEFVTAIREQREPVSGIRDAVETMILYQAIYDAGRDGRSGVIFEQ